MLDLFFTPAFAEGAAEAAKPNPLASLMPFVLIFAVFYFLMIRPQKKKLEEEKSLLAGLGKGDEIFTKSGLIGTIAGMTDKVITLEVSEGMKLKVLRSQIGGLAKKIFEKTEAKKK
jgi:preprotein translocase subunit YajC